MFFKSKVIGLKDLVEITNPLWHVRADQVAKRFKQAPALGLLDVMRLELMVGGC